MCLQDVGVVSRLVVASFMHSVARELSEQGGKTFMGLVSEEALVKRMEENNSMLVYESDGDIHGYVEVKEGRHIAMLFVHPTRQRAGVGRELILAALALCTSETVTVRASLGAVGAYLSYGFKVDGPKGESSGLRFRPMTKKTDNGSIQ